MGSDTLPIWPPSFLLLRYTYFTAGGIGQLKCLELQFYREFANLRSSRQTFYMRQSLSGRWERKISYAGCFSSNRCWECLISSGGLELLI